MSHYETFVVRLWVDDDGTMSHGEVRHLSSGTGSRFREVRHATKFIEQVITRRDGLDSIGQQRGAGESLLGFEYLAQEP